MATKQSEYRRTERKKQGKRQTPQNDDTKNYRRSGSKSKNKNEQTQAGKRVGKRKYKAKRIRLFPVWLRVIVVAILAVAALMAGLMIGYGIIGDGSPLDALKVETWQHIIDIVVREE